MPSESLAIDEVCWLIRVFGSMLRTGAAHVLFSPNPANRNPCGARRRAGRSGRRTAHHAHSH